MRAREVTLNMFLLIFVIMFFGGVAGWFGWRLAHYNYTIRMETLEKVCRTVAE